MIGEIEMEMILIELIAGVVLWHFGRPRERKVW